MRYANQITYTTQGNDGMGHERQTERLRPYPLTVRGAERILRAEMPDRPTLRVVRVAPVVAALVLSLLLPAVAQAEPGKPCKVNVNTATPTQLQYLIRTGPVLAGEIVEVRGEGYDDLEELDRVRGIGPAWLRDNSKHVAFSGPTTCTSKQAAPKGEKE